MEDKKNIGYSVKCKGKQEIINPKEIISATQRLMMQGEKVDKPVKEKKEKVDKPVKEKKSTKEKKEKKEKQKEMNVSPQFEENVNNEQVNETEIKPVKSKKKVKKSKIDKEKKVKVSSKNKVRKQEVSDDYDTLDNNSLSEEFHSSD